MRTARLGEVFKITSGGTPNRSHKEYYEGGIIPWVKTGDLKVKDLYAVSENITEEGLENSSAKIFPKDTILIAMYGATIGACSILKIEAATNQACAALLPNEKVDTDYLYYYLMAIKPKLIDKGIGGGQPNISATILKEVEFPFPDLQTQKQIAQILENADRARQGRKAANALTEQFLQSSFLHLFGDPVRNEKGWELRKLEELGKWQSGGTPSRQIEEFFDGTIPWYTSGELNQMFVSESSEYITEQAIKSSNAKLVEPNSLLLGMYDTAALKSSITTINSACNQAIAYSKLEFGKANLLYVYHAIQYGKEHFRSQQRGVRQKNLNLTMIKELQLPIPPLPLQQHFASLVADAEILRQKQQQSEKELEHMFQALLQRYFGESKSYTMDEPFSLAAETEESYSVGERL